MFSATGHYGFCQSERDPGEEVFFHAQDFHRLQAGGPPPILGERVQLGEIQVGEGRRPRTNRVLRVEPPQLVTGSIHSFDSNKGWGFVSWKKGQAFLHMSDRAEDWMPVIGSPITFYVGYKSGRVRACWARPIRADATYEGERVL